MGTFPDTSQRSSVRSSTPHGDLPLVDWTVLHDLEQQFDNPAIAHGFVSDFVNVWEERYAKLAAAILAEDQAASLDSVLSAKITSMMVGATRMARMAVELEDAIRKSDIDFATAALPALKLCGEQTVRQLVSRL